MLKNVTVGFREDGREVSAQMVDSVKDAHTKANNWVQGNPRMSAVIRIQGELVAEVTHKETMTHAERLAVIHLLDMVLGDYLDTVAEAETDGEVDEGTTEVLRTGVVVIMRMLGIKQDELENS